MKSTPKQIKDREFTKALTAASSGVDENISTLLKFYGSSIHKARLTLREIRAVKPAEMTAEYTRKFHKPTVRYWRSLVNALLDEQELRNYGKRTKRFGDVNYSSSAFAGDIYSVTPNAIHLSLV